MAYEATYKRHGKFDDTAEYNTAKVPRQMATKIDKLARLEECQRAAAIRMILERRIRATPSLRGRARRLMA